MKNFVIFLSVLILMGLPALAFAHCGSCSHDQKDAKQMAATHQGHGDHKGHDGMSAGGSTIELGTMSAKGIKGVAEIKDVRASMAKMGMKTTHHLMVSFIDEKTGKPVESGTVAVKINDPDGVATGPMELMGMAGHFGADVILDKQGEYHFILGTKLADGETRQYHYHTVIK